MKRSFLAILCIAAMIQLSAQVDVTGDMGAGRKTHTNKSFYGEAGGGGLIFSANFDARFPGAANLGYRVGLGVFPSSNTVVTVPVGVYYLIGDAPNYFEVEVTGTYASSEANFKSHKSDFFFYPHVAYRFNRNANAFFLKIEAGPLFVAGKVYPFPGLGFGYTLGK